jgi:hypothetical protein
MSLEFTLIYREPLKANDGPAAKQKIRRAIHQQLRLLWGQQPLAGTDWLKEEAQVSLIKRVGSFRLVPLVSPELALIAELNISFLRPEAPGSLITQGGDIDNRLKTLLDALRIPKVAQEIPPRDVPKHDEDPFFCLLEDDNLVTRLSVKTDRLLEPVTNPSEVLLLIHVRTKNTVGTFANLALG